MPSCAQKLQLECDLELLYNCGACFQDMSDIGDTVFNPVFINDKHIMCCVAFTVLLSVFLLLLFLLLLLLFSFLVEVRSL